MRVVPIVGVFISPLTVSQCLTYFQQTGVSMAPSASSYFLRGAMPKERELVLPLRLRLRRSPSRSCKLQMNILSDIGDLLSGGKLTPQNILPHGRPLCDCQSIGFKGEDRCLAIQERPLSFTGEDFDVVDVTESSSFFRSPVVTVRGAMLHLPGKDKMRIYSLQDGDDEKLVLSLDRKLVALTPTYDIYRSDDGEKMGWIDKEILAMTDTFNVHIKDKKEGWGLMPPAPAYRIGGDFVDRNFVMKNEKGEVVAKVQKDGLFQFDSFNHYQVRVAPGMDAVLVIACACVIDEELDEEHKERKKREEQ